MNKGDFSQQLISLLTEKLKAGSNITITEVIEDGVKKYQIASNFSLPSLNANKALKSDENGVISVSTVTSTELEYLSGVTGGIQTQLGGKLSISGGIISGDLSVLGNLIVPANTRPTAAMTANNLPSPFVASASTEYSSSYQAWRAFNRDYGDANSWVSTTDQSSHWIQLKMDKALYNIKVTMYNRTRVGLINGPMSGTFQGSNTGAAGSWVDIGTFTDRNGSLAGGGGGASGEAVQYSCNNTTAYLYLRIVISTWYQVSENYCAIGEIYIDGQAALTAA